MVLQLWRDAPSQAGYLVKELAEGAVHRHRADDALQRELLGKQPGRVGHHLGRPGHGGQGCGCAAFLLTLPQLVLSDGMALERGACSIYLRKQSGDVIEGIGRVLLRPFVMVRRLAFQKCLWHTAPCP